MNKLKDMDKITMELYPVDVRFQPTEYAMDFMVADIHDALLGLGLRNCYILEIRSHYMKESETKNAISEIVDFVKDNNNILLCVKAYASTLEYPEEEYYDPNLEVVAGKKPVPFDEVLSRESRMFEELDFININDAIQYEQSIPFIYSNKIGKMVIDYMS